MLLICLYFVVLTVSDNNNAAEDGTSPWLDEEASPIVQSST